MKKNAQFKNDLLSLISHELRTPLTSILNAVRYLDELKAIKSEHRPFLEMALRNADRLNKTINELLDLSKLAEGQIICRFNEINLATLLSHFRESISGLNVGNRMRFTIPARLPWIYADGLRLESVLRSLIENAVQYSSDKTSIEFSTRIYKQKINSKTVRVLEFSVSNFTSGLSKLDEKRLIQSFTQKDETLSRRSDGLGSSLALASDVAKQHGGSFKIVIDSVNNSQRFTALLKLPIIDGKKAVEKVLESRIYGYGAQVRHVSVVLLEFKLKNTDVKYLVRQLQKTLFRASDHVYRYDKVNVKVNTIHRIALILDDCHKRDVLKILNRILKKLGSQFGKIRYGFSSCPEDSTDPAVLLDKAEIIK